jgi:hypothetical protein
MVWKIAVDMSRPLVHSEGNLDPSKSDEKLMIDLD